MADNLSFVASVATFNAACDEVTYSGDASQKLQLIRSVKVTGAEGSKVVGALHYHVVAAGTTNAAVILANPGEVHSVRAFSIAPDPVFVKLHNVNVTPTPGVGVHSAYAFATGIPLQYNFESGIPFSTGIGITILRGITDASTTAMSGTDQVVVDIEYTRTA